MLSVSTGAGERDRVCGLNAAVDEDCGRVDVCAEHWTLVRRAHEVLSKPRTWNCFFQEVGFGLGKARSSVEEQ